MLAHLMFSGALDELKTLRILCAHGALHAVPNRRFIHASTCARAKANTQTRPRNTSSASTSTRLPTTAVNAALIDMVGANRIVIGTTTRLTWGRTTNGGDRCNTDLTAASGVGMHADRAVAVGEDLPEQHASRAAVRAKLTHASRPRQVRYCRAPLPEDGVIRR